MFYSVLVEHLKLYSKADIWGDYCHSKDTLLFTVPQGQGMYAMWDHTGKPQEAEGRQGRREEP